jgi:cell division initiation protein
MKLTPLDIRHKEFRRAVRGYSDEEVDVFLDEVADEFERLFQDNIELRERQRQLEDQVAQYESIKETLNKTLVSAQQQADETRTNAHKEADLVLRDAELKGRGIINEAYGEKQKVQQSLIQLRQAEEDFRFKFRSLLEAHLNLLAEDEASEDRRGFRGLVAEVEGDLEPTGDDDDSTGEQPAEGLPGSSDDPARSSAVEPAVPGTGGGAAVGAALSSSGLVLDDPNGGDDHGDHPPRYVTIDEGAAAADDPEAGAPIKRFIFGKRERDDEDFFEPDGGRDFEW